MQHILVLEEGDLTLRHITLQDGIDDTGGAIFVAQNGTARLESVILRNNEANGSDSDGGAIHNRGTLVVRGSQFLNNHADDGGGAINNNGGTVSIRAGIFAGNTALNGGAINNSVGRISVSASLLLSNTVDNLGGGLFAPSGFVTVTNTTIAHNSAFRGGGIYGEASGSIYLLNSTVYTNTASSAAGGIWNSTAGDDANVTLKNTIVAGNNDPNAGVLNCDGPAMRTLGHNLIGDGTCIDATTGDLKSTDPLLGALAENGSIILSFEPLAGSPAIDGGDNIGCPRFDQRGYPRPIGDACDIGSVEAGFALWLPAMLKEE
jgi:predicted outer membrane repeat protein